MHANEPSVNDFCLTVDGERKELRIGKGQTKAIINDFNPIKEYTFKVIAVSGSQQSRALEGSFAGRELTHSIITVFLPLLLAKVNYVWLNHHLCLLLLFTTDNNNCHIKNKC